MAESQSSSVQIDLQTPDGKSRHYGGSGGSSNKKSENNTSGRPQTPNSGSNTESSSNKQMNSSKKRKLNNNLKTENNNSPQSNSMNNPNFNGQQSVSGHLAGHRLTGSPAWDLPPQNTSAQTFTGRCRLFVANLPSTVTDESLRKLFGEFGEISEIFIGKGNQFAFIKMDTRSNAENAKNTLDGKPFEGRTLRVRLAAHAAAIKVSNLPPCASNELLHLAFSTFGPIERAIVIADDRGRPLNEGIIEFARKSSAQAAIKKCQNECLLLSATPIPVNATLLESRDEEEGVPDKNISHTAEYRKERELGPRFTEPNTVEHEIAKKWKVFTQHEAERRQAFEAEMHDMHDNFKRQMEYFRLEEITKQLREQLRQMESQVQQFNSERDVRYDYERQREDQRRQHHEVLRQQEEQLMGPQHNQNDLNALRRQESDLRQQASALSQILDRQEQSLRQMDPSLSQHMESNMYGHQPPMHGGQTPSMMPGQMPAPPPPPQANPMSHMNPYVTPQAAPVQYAPAQPPPPHHQQPMHPHQMNHYQQHPHGHQIQPGGQPHPGMQRPPPIVPYNGVPPPASLVGAPQPYGSQQQQQQQQPQQPQTGNMGMNHGSGGNPGVGGANYGKRTRRY